MTLWKNWAVNCSSWQIPQSYQREVARLRKAWDEEVERIFARRHGPPLSQGEVIGLLNATLGPTDIIVNAAGSLPGDLHKLWRTRDPRVTTWTTGIRAWVMNCRGAGNEDGGPELRSLCADWGKTACTS